MHCVPVRRLSCVAAALLVGLLPTPGHEQAQRLTQQLEQLIIGQRGMRVYDWVGFSIDGSEVTLEGSVTRSTLKEGIERSVAALEAVGSIRNDIEILPRNSEDIGLRINAYWRIYGHPEIRRYLQQNARFVPRLRRGDRESRRVLLSPVHIVVRDGHLVLEGELEQHREKQVTEQQAKAVVGVRSVTNNIVVTGTESEESESIDFQRDPWWIDSESVAEPVLRVENPAGGVRVQVRSTDQVVVRRKNRTRPIRPGDTSTTRLGRKMRIRARPPDGTHIDLEIDLPYGHRLEVKTVDGRISVSGLVRQATLETTIGRVELAVPWRGVRLDVTSDHRPRRMDISPEMRALLEESPAEPRPESWTLTDTRDSRSRLYGSIRVNARQPDALIVRDATIPSNSPVLMHWKAPQVLGSMLRSPYRMRLRRPGDDDSGPRPDGSSQRDQVVRFESDVRLVQLSASVVDGMNQPVLGLAQGDFEILEDGVDQEIDMVQNTEAEFNLVLLLDCSTSTLFDRKAVMEAARRFILTARESDRVGIYVLSDSYLHVVSPLTDDRNALLRMVNRIPRLSGGTPLYDAITLAYAHELARRRWERNALIVISDGMDNELLQRWSRSVPSEVSFDDLLRASTEINSVIYPIFLEPDEPSVRVERRWRERSKRSTDRARERMGKLASATGGQLFRASSIADLDAVYELVAKELRSIYTLGYYPSNPEFDGAWRRVRVRVRNPDIFVRTRPGYHAW